jgi:hypothetical protein
LGILRHDQLLLEYLVRKTLIIAALCTVLGVLVGTGVSRAVSQRHQQTHAVMWLMTAHLQQLKSGVQTHACQTAAAGLDSLRYLQGEISRVFADIPQEDGKFRARTDALAAALKTDPNAESSCDALSRQLKAVNEACDACHREFR